MTVGSKQWTVVCIGKKRTVKRYVIAEYYKIDHGVLTFRDSNACGYPIVKHVFAPGVWQEIIG